MSGARSVALVEEFLPVWDVSDAVATVVEADVGTTWDAVMRADLIELGRTHPLVGLLGGLRALPEIASHILHGELPERGPAHLRLKDMAEIPLGQGGWVLLGERPRDELLLGLVGKFWRPVIEFADVNAERFGDFAEPGYAKTVYSVAVRALGEGRTQMSGEMRTATTDEQARKWFRRYWTFGIGSGAHVLVNALVDSVREAAEASFGESKGDSSPG